jgi:hypothetical protein
MTPPSREALATAPDELAVRRAAPGAAHAVRPRRRAYWLKQLHRWHWISAAISLVGMLLFAVTGITLNHAAQIEAQPRVATRTATLPPPLLAILAEAVNAGPAETRTATPGPALPPPVRDWLGGALAITLDARAAEWSADEVYLALPRPGGDAWLRIARHDGSVEYERTDRGWIAYLNDLHKGRHTGGAWSWFLDLFALACVVFTLTGLFILKLHAANRRSTWPLVAAGLVVPLLLALLWI